MANAQNKVIAGDYNGQKINAAGGVIYISFNAFEQETAIASGTIESYEVITDEHRKSAASGISRGLVGGVLLGPVGLLAGLSAKNKGIYQVAIHFRNGKRSLIEIDDKLYKVLVKNCF